ncbi:cytochrome c oxidase copper chaperone-like [Ctenocephalides felis]|uniref:cytochrome c oxidase copper chaperone-like n=1 Tax=Ctenocephalides felis TaxID=7515 RepID=UPI000E6E2BCB|nr:cytochrome c oxidase copper chaperone-like [Ctenocephalides felis]
MGNSNAKPTEISSSPDLLVVENVGKPKCKACCACPETKKARDACIVEKGEENCGPLIEAHKVCMRKMGFNI